MQDKDGAFTNVLGTIHALPALIGAVHYDVKDLSSPMRGKTLVCEGCSYWASNHLVFIGYLNEKLDGMFTVGYYPLNSAEYAKTFQASDWLYFWRYRINCSIETEMLGNTSFLVSTWFIRLMIKYLIRQYCSQLGWGVHTLFVVVVVVFVVGVALTVLFRCIIFLSA